MTITNQYLLDQGFALEDPDDDAFTKTVGEFTVSVQVVKYGYDSATKEDLVTVLPHPRLGVHLPHQCDSWEVVVASGSETSSDQAAHQAALDNLHDFIQKAQQAYDILADLDLDQIKAATRA